MAIWSLDKYSGSESNDFLNSKDFLENKKLLEIELGDLKEEVLWDDPENNDPESWEPLNSWEWYGAKFVENEVRNDTEGYGFESNVFDDMDKLAVDPDRREIDSFKLEVSYDVNDMSRDTTTYNKLEENLDQYKDKREDRPEWISFPEWIDTLDDLDRVSTVWWLKVTLDRFQLGSLDDFELDKNPKLPRWVEIVDKLSAIEAQEHNWIVDYFLSQKSVRMNRAFRKPPVITKIMVIGQASRVNTKYKWWNEQLALDRAGYVETVLNEKFGIDSSRIAIGSKVYDESYKSWDQNIEQQAMQFQWVTVLVSSVKPLVRWQYKDYYM